MTPLRPTFRIAAAGTVALLTLCLTSASGATPVSNRTPSDPTPGYWLAGDDGGVFAFNAPFYGSAASNGAADCPNPPGPPVTDHGCTAIAATPTGSGYWIADETLLPTALGAATPWQTGGTTSLNGASGTWVGLVSSPTGKGFLLVSSNGGVLGSGDGVPLGGVTALHLALPIVGIAATPDGKGYWLVASDGGVFAFGDATFYGSMGGHPLNAPVVGVATTPDGKGYWLVASDGGIFAFGDAVFAGSMGGRALNAPMVGIAANSDGAGYWTVGSDGGVFAFGGAPFEGSMGGTNLNAAIVGIASRPG